MMKRLAAAALSLLLFLPHAGAEDRKTVWDIYAGGVGGWNLTDGGYGGAEVRAGVDIRSIVEIGLGLELQSGNIHTPALSVRPKINFNCGTLYFDVNLVNRVVLKSRINDLALVTAAGWKMKHVDMCLGVSNRLLHSLDFKENVVEPFNIAYRLQFSVMGWNNPWDVYGGMSNIAPYKIERQESAYFYLGGRYSIDSRLSVNLQADIQPTGVFHLTASFFGAYARLGLKYRF